MVASTEKRVLSVYGRTGVRYITAGIPPNRSTTKTLYPNKIESRETTTSQDNPEWKARRDILRKYRRYVSPQLRDLIRLRDIGGYFHTTKRYHWTSHHDWSCNSGNLKSTNTTIYQYRGPLLANVGGLNVAESWWPSVTGSSLSEMYKLGATAISRTIPTNPVAGVAVSLGELRNDGLPKIPGSAVYKALLGRYRALGSVGSEFLNLVFAWQPTIRDVRAIAGAVKGSAKIIEQYTRDSGRPIRRRYVFPIDRKIEVTDLADAGCWPTLDSAFYGTAIGKRKRTRITTTRTWFSGCYTYYLDPGTTALGKLKRQEQIANKLLGTRINPETLWALTPWSWAADWVSNTGDVMTNIAALANDSLVIRWAYIMQEIRIDDTYTNEGIVFKSGSPGVLTQKFSTVSRMRVKATPYGFGLDPVSFTTKQWAILGALGISRGPNQL